MRKTKRATRAISSLCLTVWLNTLIQTSGFFTTPIRQHSPLLTSERQPFIRQQASINGESNPTNTIGDYPIIPTEWKGDLLKSLSQVIDPDLNRDIVTLGFVQNLNLDPETRQLSFSVELTTPACPIKESFQIQCQDIANTFEWTNGNAIVDMTSAPPLEASDGAIGGPPLGLSQVKNIIAISSCKGGVGKSTTSVNLAYALSSLGASVGIFDVDVFGPSLPTMITPDNDAVQFVGRQIAPLQRNGVKLMSFGYVNEGSAIMRGAMVTQLLDQFLSLTYWGPLDYLIMDMPPGTGDIQLTLSQKLNITAAVIVTTPQELSFVDVQRGIEMFDSVNVPCIAVVENMAYLEMDDEDKHESQKRNDEMKQSFETALKEGGVTTDSIGDLATELMKIVSTTEKNSKQEQMQIFGKGHKERLSRQWGIDHTFSMPLMKKISANGDSGTPFILDYPDSPQADTYKELASSIVRELVKIKFTSESARPTIVYDKEDHILVISKSQEAGQDKMAPAELRRECKCAACVEELTGRQILQPSDVSDDVRPLNIQPVGNYALSVDWSDGHKSLYPYRQILSLIETQKQCIITENEAVVT